jgi:hypothetical protein
MTSLFEGEPAMDIAAKKAAIVEEARTLPDEAVREVIADLQGDLAVRSNKRKNEALVQIRRLAGKRP